jgi:hypothetical protein
MTAAEEVDALAKELHSLNEALALVLQDGEGPQIDALLERRQPVLNRLRTIGQSHKELVIKNATLQATAAREKELLDLAQRRRSELRKRLADQRQKSKIEKAYGLA